MKLLCFLIAWGLSIGLPLSLARQGYRSWQQLRRWHQIPCSRCTYFTNSPYLKCPVHPDTACSLNATDCSDFRPTPHGAKNN